MVSVTQQSKCYCSSDQVGKQDWYQTECRSLRAEWLVVIIGAIQVLRNSGLEIDGGPLARVYQKSCRATNPSEAVVRWATKTLPADITFVSFFTTFAVAVTATMLFVFNISTIVIY